MRHNKLFLIFLLFPFFLFGKAEGIERPMVLIICSYNNADWYQRNLDAVFSQDYSNYRVIYIDDCSTDGTAELVEQYIQERGLQDKIILIKNKERMFKMYRFYNAILDYCDDWDIVLDHDGDDWFKNENALSIINDAYEDPNIWLTYGDFIIFPTGEKSFCRDIPNEVVEEGSYRDYEWVTSQQRSFYAWLFKRIEAKDLMYEESFVKASVDPAYMFPMLEMIGGRFKFVKDIIYVYNRQCVNTDD